MPYAPPEQTVNIPQLLLVLIISGFAIRYFFFTPAHPDADEGGNGDIHGRQRAVSNGVRAREQDVERIQQMFPQIERRTIVWNLQRDGGNVSATAERVLSGRGLEVPPQSFQPLPAPLPNPLGPSAPITNTTGQSRPITPDLITRYNLASKISSTNPDATEAEINSAIANGGAKQAWSGNKGERQAGLQRRKEEMILAARRRMEAKVAAERGAGMGGGDGA